ncbi:MAG: putative Ig domain-containing protein [Chloroflexota bacterium]
MTRQRLGPVASVGLIALLCGASPALAQSLGSAQSFAVVGGTAVTAAGTGTVITGDVGVSPGTSITGFPAGATVVPPFGTHANDGAAIAAQSSVTSLYTTLAGTGGATATGPELGGLTLIPGTYSFTSTANIASGTTLRLSGAGNYIFKVGSAITANVGSSLVLENGASACNVFWQVTSAATLNGVTFAGNVVAQAGVTLGVGAALTGRALTTAAGAVTLSGGNTAGGCSNPPPPPPPPVCPPITLSPATLPSGTVGVAYSQTITGSGGTAPYTFAVTSGTLPGGLTLTPAGVLAGTPTSAGTSIVTIRGTDANGCFATVTYTMIIAPACPVISIGPPPPNGTVGVAYTHTLTGSGGTAPYTFTITGGTLPAGVTLTPAGVLAGTPTNAGSSSVTIRGTDANGCFADTAYTIVIAPAPPPPPVCPPITLAPPVLPNGTVGVAYNQTITGSGGTAPYTFTVTVGTLPAGMTLTPTGLLSGTPSTAGTSTVTIRGTDANGCFATLPYTIIIAPAPPPPPVCPPITLAPAVLPNGTVGVAYSQTITGSGGTAPYTFGVTAGVLPAGLILTSAGLLSGTPTTAGTSTVTIRGTDANGCFATLPYAMIVAAAPPPPPPPPVCPVISIGPPPPNGRVGVAYTHTITGSGGTAPYTFTLTSGTLPAGMTLTPAGVLAGTPTAATTSSVTIRGTDANGCFADTAWTFVISPAACPVITIAPPPPNGTVGVAYTHTLTGSGGTGPYTFFVAAGALPAGLTLTAAGVISGTPTTAGTSTFTIRGTDANGCFAEVTFTITIPTPVPTLPQAFVVLLGLGLTGVGYLRLRRRARVSLTRRS